VKVVDLTMSYEDVRSIQWTGSHCDQRVIMSVEAAMKRAAKVKMLMRAVAKLYARQE
jgi:hypothetical protein